MSRQKQPQVLEIDPDSELKFIGPFTDVVSSHLKLTNPSDKRVCFKVKTTAPRRYCVRPNSGFVEPSSTVDISVMLQPLDADIPDKGKHKFMVQSMFAPDIVEDVEKLWAEALPSDLMDSKLRCVFEGEGAEEVHRAVAEALQASPGQREELNSLMEECKRLQSENESLKQKFDEAQLDNPSFGVAGSDVSAKLKQQALIGTVLAFFLGLILGYFVL